MNIKKKFSSVVAHVKSHPTIYAYCAGSVIGMIGMGVGIKIYLDSKHLIDLDDAAKQIAKMGYSGLSYTLNDTETYILFPAPEDFQK